MKAMRLRRGGFLVSLAAVAALLGGAGSALLGLCGPFTDTANDAFCPLILEIYYLGITTGTSPTTFDPTSNVNRTQMAAFLSRTVDAGLKRGGRRAALDQYWTTQGDSVLRLTNVGSGPSFVRSDGADLWVTNGLSDSVSRVRGSDGRLLETWTGATGVRGVLVAAGYIFATGQTVPAQLYRIDPSQAAGAVTTVASNLGFAPVGMAFDGSRIWTANNGSSVSIVTPGATVPWTATTVTAGFTAVHGALYDGANIWVTDFSAGSLLKLDSGAAILQTVTVGAGPQLPIFDGTNIWVPNYFDSSVSIVRASSGAVLATLTGHGLSSPESAAFDGQRTLVTNNGGNSVSLWKAADLSPLGFFGTGAGTSPLGACSDGLSFWIAMNGAGKLARL